MKNLILALSLLSLNAFAKPTLDEALQKTRDRYAVAQERQLLKERQKAERQSLKDRQKAEREALKSSK